MNSAFFMTIVCFVFPMEPNSQDLWSLGWVSSYMAHDSMDFSPIPLDVFQTLSFAKALVNGFARLSLDLI